MSTHRGQHLSTDVYGIDPLLDAKSAAALSVKDYILFTITSDYVGRPDLLAVDHYHDNELWWVTLVYNGITSHREIVTGLVIRLPDSRSLFAALNSVSNPVRNVSTTVRV